MSKVTTDGVSEEVLTLGEMFPDGCVIELLRDNQLLLWQNGEERIAPSLTWNGQVYKTARLDPKLEELLRLPAATADYVTIQDLVTELSSAIANYVVVEADAALLMACFALSTWVIDGLPGSVCLNPWGPAGTETTLVDLLACICSRPLRLVEPSLRELAGLPEGLCPTLILKQPSEQVLSRLLAAAHDSSIHLLHSGRAVSLRCAPVACTQYPVSVPALSIPLAQAETRYRRINRERAQQLADEFRPRLLRYRLEQLQQVSNSEFDEVRFAPETRVLARILGATLEGAPEVQARVVGALLNLDHQIRVEQAQTTTAVILEAVLALLHEGKEAAFVQEITEISNAILFARSDRRELTAKEVGGTLRKELAVITKRRGPGYEVSLTAELQSRVHQFAAAHSVLTLLEPKPNCPWCSGLVGTSTTALGASYKSSTQSTQIHEGGRKG